MFADQPIEDGGDDTAPTPTEIFIASLGACVTYYAERFLHRHGLGSSDLTVACDYWWAEKPHRVGAIDINVKAAGLTDAQREAFIRVIEGCTVQNTLRVPPRVQVHVESARVAVA